MSSQATETSVRQTIVVDAPIERAFSVFTDGIGNWFPSAYNLLDVDIAERVFDISPQWQIETDPGKTSQVEVRFTAESADRTRVELEHRNLDRHGDGWEHTRDEVGGEGGWPGCLRSYAEHVAA